MSHLVRWWDGRSGGEKLALGIAGALAVVATGGALANAIATEGLVVASGGMWSPSGRPPPRCCAGGP